MIQKNITLILAIIAIVIASLGFLRSDSQEITLSTGSDTDIRTISVAGKSELAIAPDTASVSFEMTRKSINVSEATSSVNARVTTLLKSLATDGVDESDVKTTRYNVSPQYTWDDGQQRFEGYRVSQSIEITIKDLESVDKILSKIGELEVDNVSALRFFVDDDAAIREQLRAAAIKDAQNKAKDLARNLDVSLDGIVSFNEGGSGYTPEPNYRNFALSDVAYSESASIPTGENDFSSNVTIVYKIK